MGNPFEMFQTDLIKIIKKHSNQATEELKASVNADEITLFRTDVDVEEGDIIERNLPNNKIERYEIVEIIFQQALDVIPGHYVFRVRKVSAIETHGSIQPKKLNNFSTGLTNQQIFISYCKDDCDFAENIKTRLEKEEISVWHDSTLVAGEDWRNSIDNGIKASNVLIVIMSPEAKHSDYVTYEWAFALGFGIPVIPILLKTTLLHPRLESLHYLDFTNPRSRPWTELIQQLKSTPRAPHPRVKADSLTTNVAIANAVDGPTLNPNAFDKGAIERMMNKLSEESKFEWRKISTLAKCAAITEDKAIELLRPYSAVEFGKSPANETIARLIKSRIK